MPNNATCCYCSLNISGSVFYTVEHILPKSLGGKNGKYNKRPCCKGCNAMRGNMPLQVFYEYVLGLYQSNTDDMRLATMLRNISALLQELKDREDGRYVPQSIKELTAKTIKWMDEGGKVDYNNLIKVLTHAYNKGAAESM